MAADALSNLLRTVRLTGATFFDIAAQDFMGDPVARGK